MTNGSVVRVLTWTSHSTVTTVVAGIILWESSLKMFQDNTASFVNANQNFGVVFMLSFPGFSSSYEPSKSFFIGSAENLS